VRRRIALALDALVVLSLVAVLAIELTGGFFTREGGLRISARSPDRALFVGAGLLALRLLVERRTGFLGRSADDWRRLRDKLYDPAADAIPPGRPSPWGPPMALAAAGFCAVSALFLYPQFTQIYAVPDRGDPLFSMWRMGWVYRQLLGDPRPLFDANIFHPEPLTLTYSDSMLLPSLTAAPLLAMGVHPVVTYNVMFLAAFYLSGLMAYLLVHRLTGSARAAFISALIYGFYPYRFEHYSHLELQMAHWMPLGLLAVHRLAETVRIRDAILVALCAVAQLYSSMYYGIFFGLYAMIVGAVVARTRGAPFRRLVAPAGVGAAVALALAIPLARPYVAAQSHKGDRDIPAVTAFSARPTDYLRTHRRSARWGVRLLPDRQAERQLFPGATPIVFSAAALAPPIGATRLAYAAGLTAAFDVSLGFHGLVYPYLYEWFLPIRGLRVPARFSILVGLSLAILSGFAVRRLLGRSRGWTAHAIFAALALAVAADLQPQLELVPVWREPPGVYASFAGAPGVVLAEFPLSKAPEAFADNLPFMYFSIWHGATLVNGYSGFLPPSYAALAVGLEGFPDDPALKLLRERGVTHVTINCAFYGNRCETVVEAVDASRAFRRVVMGQWEERPVHVYELLDLPRQ
jgi:hypothetical protein